MKYQARLCKWKINPCFTLHFKFWRNFFSFYKKIRRFIWPVLLVQVFRTSLNIIWGKIFVPNFLFCWIHPFSSQNLLSVAIVFCWCSISKLSSNCSVSYCSSMLPASYVFLFQVNLLISFGWDCQVEIVLAWQYILKQFVFCYAALQFGEKNPENTSAWKS